MTTLHLLSLENTDEDLASTEPTRAFSNIFIRRKPREPIGSLLHFKEVLMPKKPAIKEPAALDKLFVIGLDSAGKPRGARFAECKDNIVNAALDMMLSCVYPASVNFAQEAMKLPPGRVYASGKAFIPNVRKDLYAKLTAVLAAADDGSQVLKLKGATDRSDDMPAQMPASEQPAAISGGLPRNWEAVAAGDMVLVHESADEGWWEAIVVGRDGELLTLKYRDYPKLPPFSRHLQAVALVNPGPA
jgi:hypothetical protein